MARALALLLCALLSALADAAGAGAAGASAAGASAAGAGAAGASAAGAGAAGASAADATAAGATAAGATAAGATAAGATAAGATAADADALVGLLNAYREAPQRCRGEQRPMAGVLAPSDALARVRIGASSRLNDALAAAGYAAAAATELSISGPAGAAQAMALLKQRYCRVLVDRRYTEIGVSRSGDTWRVVMAKPLLSADLGDWREAGKKVLALVNAARATARSCGDRQFAATTPLSWSDALAAAALAHSRDMARHDYFRHASRNGESVGDRVAQQGYRWKDVGENIAAGQGSPEQAVAGWLASPHHCSNIMSPDFADTGVAYATSEGSDMKIYWTQDFGKRP